MDQVIRILHLEDNAADRELIQSTLESAGMACQISQVQSCDEFTEALRKGGFDVILVDFRLPTYDGMSALRLVQELCLDIPFIFVSGTMGEEAAIEGLTQGATDYVLKQNLSRLVPAVKRALHEAENQRERKRAEEALHESESRFRMILEGIPDLVLIHNDEGTILYINAIGASQLEWSAKDLIGKNLRQIVSSEEKVLIADHIRETYKTGWCRFETTYISRSGWKIIAEVNDRPIKFGKDKAILRVSRDITERKKMEEDLRQSEERFRQFFENAPEYCYMISLEGNILDINNSALNVLGYKKDEINGKPLQMIYAPESLLKMKQLFTRWKKTGQLKDEEIVINTKKGDKRTVLLSAAVLKDAEGKALQSISVQKDITERKQNETINISRLHLIQFSLMHSLDELLEETLNETEKLTGSLIGFYHFVDDDQKSLTLQNWSTKTKSKFCTAKEKGLHYPISDAGVWVDCVYQRKPVIHNDYGSLSNRKGMPEGHAAVSRELVVPVFRGEKIRAILGVGNKPTDYTQQDVETVSLLADLAWEIAERKQAEESVRRAKEYWERTFDAVPDLVAIIDAEFHIIQANKAMADRLNLTPDECIGEICYETIHGTKGPHPICPHAQSLTNGLEHIAELREERLDGDFMVSTTPLFESDGRMIGSVHVARDITERKQAEEALRQSYHQLRETFYSLVNALISTVEKRDPYTAGHQRRTTILACAIAEEMGLSEERIEGIRMAGAIHDIGKIEVPIEILSRPGSLTDVQYEMVKIHPRTGHDILKGIKFPWPVAEIVLQHHERMDGSGYPQGIKGEKIMLESQILAVADVVEAMSHYRPFRPSLGIDKALEEISQNRGVLFDPDVVDTCIRLFTDKEFKFE